jgi:hypothetical protein
MHAGSNYAERGTVELDQIRLTDIKSIMMSFSEDDNETSSSIKAEDFWRATFLKFVAVHSTRHSISNQKYDAFSYTSHTTMRVYTLCKMKSRLASF